MSSSYIMHTDFDEIMNEIAKLQEVNKKLENEITSFVNSLRDIGSKIEPTMKRESKVDEKQLWAEYQQMQREKLVLLDMKHVYEDYKELVKELNPRLDFLINDTLGELTDHIEVLTETHRAHIDILEIFNTRRIELLALIITAAISYLAVWEFFVRDLLTDIVFPYGILLAIFTLTPAFATLIWGWFNLRRRM